jgi:ABC-type uncharacterized transport system substrate-binding protein
MEPTSRTCFNSSGSIRPQEHDGRRAAGAQSTKFDFVINLRAARVLGIEVPSRLLLIADVVIE